MKRIKYLLIIATLLITPIVAKAEPIHLTQAALEECFANEGVYNETYKMEFKLEYAISGFFLSGGEYVLDEDIDLHKAHLDSGTQALVLNLNGHTISSNLDKYSPVPGYLSIAAPISCDNANSDITVIGPGTIQPSRSANVILIEAGKVTLDNVDLTGHVKLQDLSRDDDTIPELVIKNSRLTNGIESYFSKVSIINSQLNLTTAEENKCISSEFLIENSELGRDADDCRVHGLYITDHFVTDYISSKVKITGSTIKASKNGYNAIDISGTNDISIDHSYIYVRTGYPIYMNGGHSNLLMWDTHLEVTEPTNYYNKIADVLNYDTTLTDTEEIFKLFKPDDYIYYENPTYSSRDSSFNNTRYLYHDLIGPDIWIIKPTEPTVEIGDANDTTYVIPEENEIIIKVLGYKFLFNGLKINGTELPTDNYEVIDNGIVSNEVTIKLNSDYLKTLGVDEYQVEVLFANGSTNATLSVVDIEVDENPTIQEEVKGEEETVEEKKNPKTGLFNYMVLLIPLTIAGIAYLVISKKTCFKGM